MTMQDIEHAFRLGRRPCCYTVSRLAARTVASTSASFKLSSQKSRMMGKESAKQSEFESQKGEARRQVLEYVDSLDDESDHFDSSELSNTEESTENIVSKRNTKEILHESKKSMSVGHKADNVDHSDETFVGSKKRNKQQSAPSSDAPDLPSLERQRHHTEVGAMRLRGSSLQREDEEQSHQSSSDIEMEPIRATLVEEGNLGKDPESAAASVSIPTVQAEHLPSSNKQWKLYAVIALLILLVIGMAVGIPLALGDEENDGSHSEDMSPAESLPTMVPSPPPIAVMPALSPGIDTVPERKELPVQVLSAFQAISGPVMLQEGTPQNKAAQYMINEADFGYLEGTENFDSWVDPEIMELLIQQYVLAVLYFSTGGDKTWKDSLNFLEPINPCSWSISDYPDQGQSSGVECHSNEGMAASIRIVRNDLSGTIPRELGFLTELTTLELSGGTLQGSIPTTISEMTLLETLSFANNDLTGMIPTALGNLQKLQALHLNHNQQLGGTLPRTFADNSALNDVRIEGTSITSNLDEIFCQDPTRSFTMLVSDCASGSVKCCCCTACCRSDSNIECDVDANRAPTCDA